MVTLSVQEILDAWSVLDTLKQNQDKFDIKVGYNIMKMSKQIEEIAEYVFSRIFMVVDETRFENNELTDEESDIVKVIMYTTMDVEPFKIDKETFFNSVDVQLSIEDITILDLLFEEN